MEIYAQRLVQQGVAVVPLFSAAETTRYHQDYITALLQTPEVRNPRFVVNSAAPTQRRSQGAAAAAAAAAAPAPAPAAEPTNTVFVAGGFGALATASSFHNPVVRFFRADMAVRTRAFFQHLIALLPAPSNGQPLRLEQLIDRFCIRRMGTSTTAETWHRDQSPRWAGETPGNVDSIFGGWVNFDLPGGTQHFSCNPGTHRLPPGATGFAPLTPAEASEAKARKTTIDIPSGHWLIFYQNLVHEVYPSKSRYDSIRQFLGFRLTTSTRSLMEDVGDDPVVRKEFKGTTLRADTWRTYVFEEQATPPLPSGQRPPMYAKMSLCFNKPGLVHWASEDLAASLVTPEGLPKRFAPSLHELGALFPPYSAAEINMFRPQALAPLPLAAAAASAPRAFQGNLEEVAVAAAAAPAAAADPHAIVELERRQGVRRRMEQDHKEQQKEKQQKRE